MDNIRNKKGPEYNSGSLLLIFFIPKEGISSGLPIKQIASNPVIDVATIGIATGYEWFGAEFVKDTAVWETEEETTAQGTLYKEKISFNVAKHKFGRVVELDDMEAREFVVYAGDTNGIGALLGYTTIDAQVYGMRFTKKKTTSADRTGRNEYKCEFYMESYAQPMQAFNVDTLAY